MKHLTWIMVVVFICSTAVIILADSKITMDVIKIDSPKKTSKGEATEVIFKHKLHAEERAKSCEPCHPPIKTVVGDPVNDQKLVHAACKNCHNKDKPAKTFACGSCHTVKASS